MAEAKTKKAVEKKSPAKKAPKAKKTTEVAATPETKTRRFKDFTILTKRSGRFEVIGLNGKNVNGLDKAKILVEAKLVKTGLSKAPAKEEAPASEEAPPSA